MSLNSPPKHQSLPLPIHLHDLRFAAWICLSTIGLSGVAFGFIGGLVHLNGMLPGFFTGTTLTLRALGGFIYFFYTLLCLATYGVSFLLSGLVIVLLLFFLLRLASLAIRVHPPVAKRLVVATSAASGFLSGVFGVGAWQPLGTSTWIAACLAATAAGITTWLKAMPHATPTATQADQNQSLPQAQNLGRSTWNDLE